VKDEGAVRKLVERCLVAALRSCAGLDALGVQPRVDSVGAALAVVQLLPDGEEAVVVLAPAQRARPVTCREGGRLVEEEELGEAAGLQQCPALPAAKLEPARDPAPAVETPADPAGVVVEAAAVPLDEAACGHRDELAEGSDAVLQRHGGQARMNVSATVSTVRLIANRPSFTAQF
jgi:hypothetical protein